MFARLSVKVCSVVIALSVIAANQRAAAGDRDDITDILPENVMFYANVNCQQFIKPQKELGLLLTSRQFDGIFRDTVFLPVPVIMAYRGFESTALEQFLGEHLLFALGHDCRTIEFAFLTDQRKIRANVFQGVASFKLKDRQIYEDFVAEHLDAWNESKMRHTEVESKSHDETGVHFHEFCSPFGPKPDQMYAVPVAYTWWFDGRVWISTHHDLAERMVERCQAPEQFNSLARNNQRFAIVFKSAEANQTDLASQFFIDYLNTFEKHPFWNYGRSVEMNGEKKSKLQRLKTEFGKDFDLPYRDFLALSAEIHADEDLSRWRGSAKVLYAVPRRDTLSKMKLQLAKDWQVESWLPETVASYATTQFDPASEPDAVRELSTRMLGMDHLFRDAGQELIEPILRQLSETQRQKLSSELTGRMTTVATAGHDSKIIMLELKDAEQPLSSLADAAARWREEAKQVELGERKTRSGRYALMKHENYEGADIYFAEVVSPSESYKNAYGGVFYAVSSVARIDNYLVFSNDREFLKAAIEQRQSDEKCEFVRALRTALAKSADRKHSDLVIFSKAPGLSRITYDWLRVPPANRIFDLTSASVPSPRRLTGPHYYLDAMNTLATKLIERIFTDPDQHALITVSQTEKTFEIQFSIK